MPDLPGNGQGAPDFSFQSAFTDAANQPPEQPTPQAPPVEPVQPTPAMPQAVTQQWLEPPQATPEPQPQPPVAPPTVSEIAQAAANAGFDPTGKTDAQIVSEMATQYQSLKPYATYGRQLAPYADQIQEYFASQQEQQQAPQPAQPTTPPEPEWTPQSYFKDQWKAPEWDEKYTFAIQNGMVQRNGDTGLWEPAAGFEVMVGNLLPGMNQAQSFTHQQWQEITRSNPYEKFYNVLREPMQKAWQTDIDQLVERKLSERESRRMVDKFEQDNSAWLYQADPATGQRFLTDQGQAYYNAVSELRTAGISDPQTLVRLAGQMVRAAAAAQPGEQPPTTSTPAAPQAQPIVPPPAQPAPTQAPVNPVVASAQQQQSFLQNAMDRARHSPNSGGYTQAVPDHPINVNEAELNSTFVTAYQQAQGGR